MEFRREEAIRSSAESPAYAESRASRYLILSSVESPFFNPVELGKKLKVSVEKRCGQSVNVDVLSSVVDSVKSLRQLARAIPRYDSISLYFDGITSSIKSIIPAVLIARFYGKEISLYYYPPDYLDGTRFWHRKIMPLFSRVFVSSRFEQRQLAGKKISSDVKLPPVSVDSFVVRKVKEVQPRILVCHQSSIDAGAVCLIQAFKMVKEKYPRAELSIISSNETQWQSEIESRLRTVMGAEFFDSNDMEEIKSAFQKADLFVSCSPSETVSQELLAAMASGMPVISFESYGAREIIENGLNGLLVRHNDQNLLADKIIQLVEEPALVEKISIAAAKIQSKLTF